MEETSSRKKWIVIIVVALLIGAGAAGFFYMQSSSTQSASIAPTSVPIEQEPMPTEEPTVNKEELKVKILNGSGVVGEATKVKTLLEGADFVVDSTGNADNYDYSTTEIQVKSTVPSSITNEISELMETDYTVDTAELDESEDVDIVVIIGTRKNAPTAKPTSGETSVTTKPTAGTATPTVSTTTAPSVSPTPTKVP